MKIDYWFKVAILFIAIGFLIIFYHNSGNGRFAYYNKETSDSVFSISDRYVVDTKTGIMYGHINSVGTIPSACYYYYYKRDLILGKLWIDGKLVSKETSKKEVHE